MLLANLIRISIPQGLMVVCPRCGDHFAVAPKTLNLAGVRKVCACCGGEISSSDNALYRLFARTTETGTELACAHYRCAKDCEAGLLGDGFLPVDAH